MRIGIDLMGGDNPPELLFPAIIEAAKQLPSVQSLLVIATKPVVDHFSSLLVSPQYSTAAKQIAFEICDDVIAMTDDPLSAVRHKKRSSLVLGMQLLKKKEIDAFVSCGNTGALIASAALSLPLLPGVSHPALLAMLPTEKGSVAVLDVGGNVVCKAEHLVRFAFLGAAYQRAIHGIERPSVGLLNVGVESRKGNAEVREAYELLQAYCKRTGESGNPLNIHFSGNIEGRDLFKGTVDVLVTDGFTGNVLLKTAEGVASFVFESLQEKMEGGLPDSFQKSFNELKKQFNYAEYPGAIVCGIDAIVVKVHGNATAAALLASILSAAECVKKQVTTHVKSSYISWE